MFYFGLGDEYWTSKTIRFYRHFFASKCFIPRREMRSKSSRGPIVFTYVLFMVRRRNIGLQKPEWFIDIFLLQNILLYEWDGRVGRMGR